MRIHVKTGSLTFDSKIGFDTDLSPCTVNVLYIKNNSTLEGVKNVINQAKARSENGRKE
jgi:hypothetical protein